MKSFIFLILIATIFGASSVSAQNSKSKNAVLPAGIADWQGGDSDKILKNPAIKIRMRKLLGKKNYAAFMESFEMLTPVEKSGDVLFSSGCLIHACGHLESAIAINVANNTIHAAIYRENEKTVYFNERNSKIPESIAIWASRLSDLNNNK